MSSRIIHRKSARGSGGAHSDVRRCHGPACAGVIDLSIGDPKDDPPQFLIEALEKEVKNKGGYHYPDPVGEPSLRNAIANYYGRTYGVELAPDDICVTSGARQGLDFCLRALDRPRMSAAYVEPAYFGIPEAISSARMVPAPWVVEALLGSPRDLEKKFREVRGGAFIVNSPQNPLGAVLSSDKLEEIRDVARTYDVSVLSDFVYAALYEGELPRSYLERDPFMLEIWSFSKTFRACGMRLGFVAGKGAWMRNLRELRSRTDNGVPPFIQRTGATLLDQLPEVEEFRESIRERRKIIGDGLKKVGFSIKRFSPGVGTNFVWARIPETFKSSDDAAKSLLKAGIKVLSGPLMGKSGEGFLRFSLNYKPDVLQLAVQRIQRVVREYEPSAESVLPSMT